MTIKNDSLTITEALILIIVVALCVTGLYYLFVKIAVPDVPVKIANSFVAEKDVQTPIAQSVNCVHLLGADPRRWKTNDSAHDIYVASSNTGKFRFVTTDGKQIIVSGQVVVEPCEK